MDFVLKPYGASIPELSATEPTLLAALVIAYALLHGKYLSGTLRLAENEMIG